MAVVPLVMVVWSDTTDGATTVLVVVYSDAATVLPVLAVPPADAVGGEITVVAVVCSEATIGAVAGSTVERSVVADDAIIPPPIVRLFTSIVVYPPWNGLERSLCMSVLASSLNGMLSSM